MALQGKKMGRLFLYKRNLLPLIVPALISFVFMAQARAQDADVAAPRVRHQRQQEAPPAPPKPVPDAPATERKGDDLLVHSPGGDYSMPDFFKGMEEGTQRAITVQLPGRGACIAQIDVTGAVIDMSCK